MPWLLEHQRKAWFAVQLGPISSDKLDPTEGLLERMKRAWCLAIKEGLRPTLWIAGTSAAPFVATLENFIPAYKLHEDSFPREILGEETSAPAEATVGMIDGLPVVWNGEIGADILELQTSEGGKFTLDLSLSINPKIQ